ncbi:hypothetical protein [Bradyrhizobium sp. CCBAU 25338]|uniref:hypothetical protein n=1 Tax=Bradyrhizobium sp. CCBAU 25338 TaxID=1641877 RepID=UPI002304CD7B|nr:hypothetical protein [Bradyrhizobium sp. CCBAU 25338]MDA9532818.1 hypothetical protein [Bradyrhizobium sp. CCBAU 25338]
MAAEIETGNDMRPYLSDQLNYGYVRAKDQTLWGNKDYVLNAYEMHHLHLSPSGTKELLYVSFSRVDAFFLMVGDHKSFDDGTLAQAVADARVGTSYELKGILGSRQPETMSEHNRRQRRGLSTAFQVGDQVVMGALLSSAGTSPLHTMHADRITEAMQQLDVQIDEPQFGRDWFEQNGKSYPATPTFKWAIQYCDLYLVETTTSVGFPIVKWRR